jgi:hypothetical protein
MYKADWYTLYKSSKSDRDKRNYNNITLYHASPNRINVFSPRSRFNGQAGVYLSPSYKSLVGDWMPYVFGRKSKNDEFQKIWHQMHNRVNFLDDKKYKTPEEELEIKKLEDKIDKMRETLDSSSYRNEVDKGYSKLYIHTVSCPEWVYDKCMDNMRTAADSGYAKDNFGFWGWGDQVFITSEYLKYLEIANVKEMNTGEFLDECANTSYGTQKGRYNQESLKPKKLEEPKVTEI